MCWKEEWAYAIRNINGAIKHIERAKERLEKRRDRARKHYQKLNEDKKHRSVNALLEIQERITGNNRAIDECDYIVAELKDQQKNLRALIEEFGINQKTGGSAKVKKILEEAFIK